MGLLTDFFVAPSGSLDPATVKDGPDGIHPTARWKNVDTVKLATLQNLLTGEDYDVAMARLEKGSRSPIEDEGPWTYELPEGLVKALVGLTPQRTREIAELWIKTEEWMADGTDAESTDSFVEMLESFSSLARKAVAGGGLGCTYGSACSAVNIPAGVRGC